MLDNVKQLQKLQGIVRDPTSSDQVQALTTVIATLEHRQLAAVEDLHDGLGLDGLEVGRSVEERQQQLLALVDALASGRFEAWWFEEVVAEHIENHEDARPYAGLSPEEWADQQAAWAETYRERAGDRFEDASTEELARMHVERKFGVSLGEFEREVVEYDRRRTLQTVLAGNFEAVEQGIRTATATVESDRVVVLPEDIEERDVEEIAEELAEEFDRGESDG